MGGHVFLQGIFQSQGSNLSILCLLHWQVGSVPLAPSGKLYFLHFSPLIQTFLNVKAPVGIDTLFSSTFHLFFLTSHILAIARSLQSCPTLCDPIDGSPPGSPVPGILQARILEWGCHFLLQCMKVKSEVAQSCLTLSDPMDCSKPGSSVLHYYSKFVQIHVH